MLDWTESDVGDAHADIAATIVLFKSAPVSIPNWLHRLVALPGRGMLRRRYVPGYRRLMPLDRGLLSLLHSVGVVPASLRVGALAARGTAEHGRQAVLDAISQSEQGEFSAPLLRALVRGAH